MNEPGMPSDPSANLELQELRGDVQALRSMIAFILLLMFVFSLCVNLFLFHQAAVLNSKVEEGQRTINNFENISKGEAFSFWNALSDYGTRHPDFAPILAKYRPFISIHTNAPAPKK